MTKKPFAWASQGALGTSLARPRAPGKVRGSAGATIMCFKKPTPPKDEDGQDKRLRAFVLRRAICVLVLHVSPKGSAGGSMRVLSVDSAAGR